MYSVQKKTVSRETASSTQRINTNGKKQIHTKLVPENLKQRGNQEDMGINTRIILNLISNKCGGR
jgi:hypothetical protein